MISTQVRCLVPRPRLAHVAAYAVLMTFAIVFLTPYVWAVFESFKSHADANSRGLLPHAWTLDNYGAASHCITVDLTFAEMLPHE